VADDSLERETASSSTVGLGGGGPARRRGSLLLLLPRGVAWTGVVRKEGELVVGVELFKC